MNYFKMVIMTVACVFVFGSLATAEAKDLNAKASESKVDLKTEVKESQFEDLDKEVTDIKLRASSGKKRSYSASLFISYAGGSLAEPGSDTRPNVGDDKNPFPVSLSTDVAFRYRMNKNESLFFASGLYQATPFHDSEREERRGKNDQVELNTVFFGYNNTYAARDVQVGSNWRVYFTTQDSRREFGELATLGYSLSAQNPLGQSKFVGALRADLYYTYYDKDDDRLKTRQVDYGIGIVPTLQWNPSNKWNIYTSANVLRYRHVRADDFNEFKRAPATQTFGAGVAVVRDFYLSPFIQFEPENLSSDRTSVNLSATINL